jgi:hypothetical protein
MYSCTLHYNRLCNVKTVHKMKTLLSDEVVENGSAFVYSAYIDDRPAKDFTPDPHGKVAVVRIFAYFLRTIDVHRKWKCVFWYGEQDQPIAVNISNVTDLNVQELTLS